MPVKAAIGGPPISDCKNILLRYPNRLVFNRRGPQVRAIFASI
jgi:hypothetical protein